MDTSLNTITMTPEQELAAARLKERKAYRRAKAHRSSASFYAGRGNQAEFNRYTALAQDQSKRLADARATIARLS